MKHTPGPWTAHGTEIRHEGNGVEYPIASVSSIIPYEEAGDDSHLIAASPELLEACKEAMDWLLPANPGSSRYIAWDACRLAIRKATEGREP